MNRLANIKTPVIFAHRGSSAHAPENTLSAFALAKTHGADAIELDVKLSKDQQVVVIHDQTVDRTTDGSGYVHQKTLSELKGYDAGAFFSHDFTGERIPSLAEVFKAVEKDVFINIELTNYSTPFDSLPSIVASLVKDFGQEDNVIFSSFKPLNLIRIKRLLPQTPVAILALPGAMGHLSRSIFGRLISPNVIHPNLKDTTTSYIKKQQELKRRVHVWTVNSPEDITRLFDLSVDGIFTDEPLLARGFRDKK